MGQETSRVPTAPRDGWSIETALDHVLAIINEKDRRYEQRFQDQQKAVETALVAQEKAVNAALDAQKTAVAKAESATEKRFESVNEFRGTLDNQQRTLIPRSEVAVIVEGLNEKVAQLTKQQDELKMAVANKLSEQKGVTGGWGYAVGALGLVLTIVTLGVLVFRTLQR